MYQLFIENKQNYSMYKLLVNKMQKYTFLFICARDILVLFAEKVDSFFTYFLYIRQAVVQKKQVNF